MPHSGNAVSADGAHPALEGTSEILFWSNDRMVLTVKRLACIACVFYSCAISAEDRQRAACDWNAYHPLKFGTPIVGGHDRLATFKVMPTYPAAARRDGVRGKVTSEVLINRSGAVVKTCSRGERVLVKAVDAALMKWKFVKDFGIRSEHPEEGARFAVLSFTFDFDSGADDSTPR